MPAHRQPVAAAKPSLLARLAAYRKTVVALLAGGLGWAATTIIPDGHIDRAEWYALAVVVAGVFGVYAAPNTPPTTDPEAGHSGIGVTLFVVILAAALLLGFGVNNWLFLLVIIALLALLL